jgi:hypothetical protein
MAKLGIFASILTICAALGYATVSSSPVEAAGECKRSDFKTKMVKEACASGGQKAAKDAMKAYLKTAKTKDKAIKDCSSCHTKVGGDYPLKANAMELFVSGGGELLDAGKDTKKTPAKEPVKVPAPTETK